VTAVGMNREVHFATPSEQARDRVGDTVAPKPFWGDFLTKDDAKAGGMRSLVMEQSIFRDNRVTRIDGLDGFIRVQVEPSLNREVRYGVFVAVNDHYDLARNNQPSDGATAAQLVQTRWQSSVRYAENLIDRIMELTDDS
jgi:hypothetical protein